MVPRVLLPPLAASALALGGWWVLGPAVAASAPALTASAPAASVGQSMTDLALPPAAGSPAAEAPPEGPAPGARVPFGRRLDAPHDPWSDSAEDGAACRAALREAGVTFRALPDRPRRDARGCGIPHPVFVTRGPTGITYAGPLLVDCSLALELPAIERVIQEQARETLGEPIVRVTTLGSYSCRGKRGAAREGLSEHALGNAIDLASFHGKTFRATASVAAHYDPDGRRPPSAAGEFLHRVQRRLREETRLTRVLGPDWNASHRDHFHIDRGLPWWWGRT